MKKPTPSYQYYRFPAATISYPVRLQHQFCLITCQVEALLANRDITVTYETVRQ